MELARSARRLNDTGSKQRMKMPFNDRKERG